MPDLYPEIEPHAHGMLEASHGNRVYWEVCGNPAGKPAVGGTDIDFTEQWINDGCPDAPAMPAVNVSLTTGGQRPDPMIHVAFWREFDASVDTVLGTG